MNDEEYGVTNMPVENKNITKCKISFNDDGMPSVSIVSNVPYEQVISDVERLTNVFSDMYMSCGQILPYDDENESIEDTENTDIRSKEGLFYSDDIKEKQKLNI